MEKKSNKGYWVRFRKYWHNIFSRSASDIWDYIKGAIAMALLVIVATIAASILTANGLLDEAVTKGYISDANNWIRTLASLLVLSFVYLFWSILKYPPIIHNEQGNKIRSLNNRLKIKTIKTTKIIFKTKDALLEDSKGYWYAYLEILNSEN